MSRGKGFQDARWWFGLGLVIVGGVVLLGRALPLTLDLGGALLGAAAFFTWALVRRQPAWLVPAGILGGLGLGLLAMRVTTAGGTVDRGLFYLGGACGWAAITLLSQQCFRRRVWWPLAPAALMLVIGGGFLASARVSDLGRAMATLWPLAAIGLGFGFLLSRRGRA